MQKSFVFFLLLLGPLLLSAQQKTPIKFTYDQITGVPEKKVSYLRNPVFRQDNATLTSDSAVFYSERNYFEAYNRVHINQERTDIYSDELKYDGNTKKAHLTGNVQMIDGDGTTLTTDILDYDMAAKIGTYTSGGKIVSKDVTLTSRNGYYFSRSNDAYFRYNVVAVTPQTTIKSDTMRYNTQSKWAYFYGPTNIKGKDDNLYTENGAYNTQTQDAYFGKKNLYTQDTKSLKGDSLYYYGAKGYGKAVKNIVFSDTKDKIKMYGDLGYYYKADKRTLVTRKAYLGIGTDDSVTVDGKKKPDSLWVGADTLITQMVLRQTLKLIPKISIKADNQVGEDEPERPERNGNVDKNLGAVAEKIKPTSNRKRDKKTKENDKKNNNKLSPLGNDSLKTGIDSLAKKIKDFPLDSLVEKKKLKSVADSIIKNLPKPPADSVQKKLLTIADSLLTQSKVAQDKLPVNLKKPILDSAKTMLLKLKPGLGKKDSIKLNPLDTVQARIIKAYYHVKVFKSNIQAKTDSLFYTSADSTLRCYQNPIVWAEGSQQIADTIYVQFKNKKLNNLQSIKNAFLVNTPKDSLRFNQIKGRLMTGFFADGQLKTMYVDGNAESIYYTQDDSTKVYKEVNQTLSSRIKFVFKDKDIEDVVYIKGVEGAINPDSKVPIDNVLTGFSWKPKERPKSKKDAITPTPIIKNSVNKRIASKATKKPASKSKETLKKVVEPKKIDSTKLENALPKLVKPLDSSNLEIKPIFPKKDTVLIKKAF